MTSNYFCRPGLFLALVLALYATSCHQGSLPQTFSSSLQPSEDQGFIQLKPYGSEQGYDGGDHRFSAILYFSELSCTTCSDMALKKMAGMFERLGDRIDFLLIVHGQDPIYLSNLRRVGQVRWPILLETHPGQSGFHTDSTMLTLLDKQRQVLVATLMPNPDTPGQEFARFEKAILDNLDETSN